MISLNLYNMIMPDSPSDMRRCLFEEFFSPTKILINHQRFNSFKKFVEWGLKILYDSMDNKVLSYDEIIKKAFSSPSFLTTFDSGVCIAHLKIGGLTSFYSLFVVLSSYLIESNTKKEVRSMFLLFSPLLQEYFEKHLNILGLVSNLLRDPSTVKNISELRTPDEVYLYLKKLL